MFEALLSDRRLHSLIPFVRQWYALPSKFQWRDDAGIVHDVMQGDGGEQGDAPMLTIFCLALRPGLEAIKARLPLVAFVFAYLDNVYNVFEPVDTHDFSGSGQLG